MSRCVNRNGQKANIAPEKVYLAGTILGGCLGCIGDSPAWVQACNFPLPVPCISSNVPATFPCTLTTAVSKHPKSLAEILLSGNRLLGVDGAACLAGHPHARPLAQFFPTAFPTQPPARIQRVTKRFRFDARHVCAKSGGWGARVECQGLAGAQWQRTRHSIASGR